MKLRRSGPGRFKHGWASTFTWREWEMVLAGAWIILFFWLASLP